MARETERRRDIDKKLTNRVREKMEKQERGGGDWAVNIPQEKQLKLEDNTKTKGVCIKRLDFLPYITSNNPDVEPGEPDTYRTYGVHRNVGVDNKTVICLKETFKKKCYVTEYQADLHSSAKTEAEKKVAKSMWVSKRALYNVIDLDDDKAKVFDISMFCFGDLLKIELDTAPDYKYDSFANLTGGFTLEIRFVKEYVDEKDKKGFYKANKITFIEREDYDPEVLEEMTDLDTLFKVLTYEQQKALVHGKDIEDAEEPEEEEKSSRRRGRKEEPEEEEKSSRRRGRKEEPEESEDAEEPEEEEKSSRRRGRKEEPEEEVPEERTSRRGFSKEDEEDKPEKKKIERGSKRKSDEDEEKSSKSSDECPHGYKFGIDTDAMDECLKCKNSDACGDEYDRLKAEKKKKK